MNIRTRSSLRFVALIWVGAVVCGPAIATPRPEQRLHELFRLDWQRQLAADPVAATYIGERSYNDRWPRAGERARTRRHAEDVAALAALANIPRERLDDGERLNYDLFQRVLQDRLDAFAFRIDDYAMTPRQGLQTLSETAAITPFEGLSDYKMWIKRLATLPAYIDESIASLRQAAQARRTQPRMVIERILPQIALQVVDQPEQSPFFEPFARFPSNISEADQSSLTNEARRLIANGVVPAYRRLDLFLRTEYLPAARDSVGIWDTPDGRALYENRVRHFTTTTLTSAQIHEIGLAEVAQIQARMQQLAGTVGFKGTLQEFFERLRADRNLYYSDPNELFTAYVLTAKKIEPELPRLFGHLYRMPFGVRPMPAISAPNTTSAGYDAPSSDGWRAGYLNVNLHRPEMRPRFEIEALTLHESVPGHHLQQALAVENTSLPAFRRFAEYPAYVEGWALYAEGLGYELGLYKDAYSQFGQLSFDMRRAVRLVVDTGIHSKGWTREQVVDYFRAHVMMSEVDIMNEVDRYIAWPGQALAYKMGQRTILDLRARAERTLGPRFDIREFHDTVLASGAIPLDVLEQRVNTWIAAKAAKTTRRPEHGAHLAN